MTTTTFDTHLYVKQLTGSGMPEPQAETMVRIMSESRQLDLAHLATTRDLKELKLTLDTRFKDLQLKLGGMIMALGGLLVAIQYFG